MSGLPRAARRTQRRETHSPRSFAAITVAVALILVFAWLGLEILLDLLSRPPLLVAPKDLADALARVPAVPMPRLVAAGVVIALVGLALLTTALTGGRRARHVLDTQRAVTVVDDAVIASALARRASAAAGISPDNVSVAVSRRHVDIRLVPTSGATIAEDAVIAAATAELGSYGLEPALRPPRLRIAPQGAVGA